MPQLLLLRHGESEIGSRQQPDRTRTLTAEGRNHITQLADHLARDSVFHGRILHSPFTRTTQTAEIVARTLSLACEPLGLLVPSGSTDQLLDHLAGLTDNLMLVSHMPLVAEIANQITQRRTTFYQGTCIGIHLQDTLEWKGDMAWVKHPLH